MKEPRIIRSWLFVPADSERKLAKGRENAADALILDLEDAVADDRQGVARDRTHGPRTPAALGPHQPAGPPFLAG